MSETGAVESATRGGGLLDEAGNRIAGRQSEQVLDPLVQFAKEQPLTTALGALALGYILGKIF